MCGYNDVYIMLLLTSIVKPHLIMFNFVTNKQPQSRIEYHEGILFLFI